MFVVAAEGGRRKWQVSTDTGLYPQWSPDGTRLYAADFEGNLEAFEVDGSGASFRTGTSRVVAKVDPPQRMGNSFAVHPDGERILHAVAIDTGDDRDALLEIVTDWRRALVR